VTIDLWVEASRDYDREDADLRLSRAKVAVSSLWPFLSLAKTAAEFEQRLDLAQDTITVRVEAGMVEPVNESLREDFGIATIGTMKTASDDVWDAFDKDSQDRTKQKVNDLWNGGAEAFGFADAAHMKANRQNHESEAMRARYKAGNGTHGFDEDGDPYYEVTHKPSGWQLRHYNDGNLLHVRHAATGDDMHDAIEIPSAEGTHDTAHPAYNHKHLSEDLSNWVNENGAEYARHIPEVKRWQTRHRLASLTATASAISTSPTVPPQPTSPRPTVPRPRQMQIYSLATRSWITVEANDDASPDSRNNPVGNPYYFDGGLEEGPHTDETGMYPVVPDGPDPISPLQSQYPMQPSAWTPNNAWVERPMQFNTRSAANEHYFSGGTEGVEGDPQSGFPEDVSLPEEDERVDFYGNVPPVHGSIQAESEYHYVKPNPDGDGYVVTQKGTGKVLSHHDTKEDAEASFRAMMQSKHSGSKASPDFRDRSGSVHVLADLGDNPYSGTDNTASDSPVAPPPTMMPGGPGAEAQSPDTGSTSPSDQAAKTSRRLTSAEVRERPSAENPTGVADEFDSNTWEGFNNQRPRQDAQQRGINTPQRPREPIQQNTSSGMSEGSGEDEDEGNEREAALHVAAWAVSQALEGIAA
jgi:hypothetical protein